MRLEALAPASRSRDPALGCPELPGRPGCCRGARVEEGNAFSICLEAHRVRSARPGTGSCADRRGPGQQLRWLGTLRHSRENLLLVERSHLGLEKGAFRAHSWGETFYGHQPALPKALSSEISRPTLTSKTGAVGTSKSCLWAYSALGSDSTLENTPLGLPTQPWLCTVTAVGFGAKVSSRVKWASNNQAQDPRPWHGESRDGPHRGCVLC